MMILYSHFEALKYRFQKKKTTWINVSKEITTDWVLYFLFSLQSWHENKSHGVTFSSCKSLLWKENVKSLIFFPYLISLTFKCVWKTMISCGKFDRFSQTLISREMRVHAILGPVPHLHTIAYLPEGEERRGFALEWIQNQSCKQTFSGVLEDYQNWKMLLFIWFVILYLCRLFSSARAVLPLFVVGDRFINYQETCSLTVA